MRKQIKISDAQKDIAEQQIIEKIRNYDYDTVEYPIEVIVNQYNNGLEDDEGEIFVPDYQREFVWVEKRQSKFIESIILGIPIPYVFFADVEGRSEIVDGSQRIRTLHAFLFNKLKLQGLEKLTELNGFCFKDLSIVRQRRIKKKSLKMVALSEKTEPDARFDLFERINTGSDELKGIEVRKGIYHDGAFYTFITECSKNKKFKRLCPLSEKRTLRAAPQEMVLRFFAYSENLDKYKNKVRSFIDNYIKIKNEQFNDGIKSEMKNDFINMLNFVDENFPNGFAKVKNAKSTPRVRFEAISVGVNFALKENPQLKKITTHWLDDYEFKEHTRSDAANNTSKLKGRINYVKDEILGQ